MKHFPNVESEADFVRAYQHAVFALRNDTRTYISVHGLDREKYLAVFTERAGDLYMLLGEKDVTDLVSQPLIVALAHFYMLETSDTMAELGHPDPNYQEAKSAYETQKHIIEAALRNDGQAPIPAWRRWFAREQR